MLDVKSVLVTGAAGGLGRTICRSLHYAGYDVTALVSPKDATASIPLNSSAVTVGYVQNVEAVAAALRGVDAVIHCAALLPNALDLGERAFVDTNVHGTAVVLRSAIEHQLRRAIFFSTINVVDHVSRTATRADLFDFVQNSSDAYIRSKISAEKFLLDHCGSFDGHLAVIRPAFIYGPGNYAVWQEPLDLIQRGKMRLLDGGTALFPLIYAEDIARYIMRMFEQPSPSTRYDLHIVSHPQRTTMREVFHFIADYLGVPRPRSTASRPLYHAAKLLQWLPSRLRVGRLKYLTRTRIALYSRGCDLSEVLDRVHLKSIQLTDYQTGLSAMLDDFRGKSSDRLAP
jgi:nucleoside-diphosphate-sugar epimerase